MGDPPDHRHLVRDHQDREAQLALDAGEQVEDRRGGLRVERRGRLVGQQHLGFGRQRARDADALLLAARQLGRIAVALVGQADHVEQRLDAAPDAGTVGAEDLEGQRHVVEDGARGQQVEVLEDHADRAARRPQRPLVERADVDAVDDDPARGRLLQPVDEPDQGRLAGPAAADDAHDLAARHGQVDAVEGGDGRPPMAARIDFRNGLQANEAFGMLPRLPVRRAVGELDAARMGGRSVGAARDGGPFGHR